VRRCQTWELRLRKMTSGVLYVLMLLRAGGSMILCVIALVPVSSMGAGSMMLSPAVVASWIPERDGDSDLLRLLVLWRGTPGWFLAGGGSSESRDAGKTTSHVVTYGSVRLTLTYNSESRIAIVAGKSVDLKDDNVVFVDDVDLSSGARVVETLRIGPRMPGYYGQVGEMVAQSPRIVAFLRCDAKSPSGRGQGLLDKLCLQNLGITKKP
jgi:hypothetical protein